MTEKKQTKEIVMTAALSMATEVGLMGITREGVAKRAHVADGTVSFHFNTMNQFRRAVLRRAIHDENIPVLATALTRPEYGADITGDLRAKVIQHLSQ